MYHVGVSSVATMGRRFFNMGGIAQSLVKRDMFRVGSNLYQCNKSHMLIPYFARPLGFSSASQSSSGQIPRQEPKKEEEKKCQIIRHSKLQRERSCDEISSTQVKLDQFPGLMVHGMVENSKTRRLLRLNPDTGYFEQEQDVYTAAANHDHSHHYELQVPHGHVCRGSAYGWLFLTDDNLDMKLLNPFSGAEIQLPPVKTLPPSEEEKRWPLSKWFVYKAVFSANPSVEPRPVVLVIYGGQHICRLAFCKPGDEGWTPLEFPIKKHFQFRYAIPSDAIYHNNQFYVLSHPGYVATFDIGRRIDDDDFSVKTTVLATAPKKGLIYARDWYLVVLNGELVRFELRRGCFYDCCIEKTKRRMEEERIRDGDTTDAYSDFDFDISYARAMSKRPKTETGSETKANCVKIEITCRDDANSDEDYDFNYADADEDSETEIEDDANSDETEIEDEDEDEDDDDDDDDDDDNDDDVGKEELTCRFPCVDLNLPSLTYGIKIRRFDASEQKWVKVESLGGKAVFLGYNTSFSLSASDYPAGHCIPDSIYFTYGGFGNARTEKACYDMGIYNVKDKSVKRPLYPPMPMDDDDSEFTKPAPIWIVNSVAR